MNQDYSHIQELLARYLNGESTDKEEEVLQKWRQEKASHETLFQRITSPENIKRELQKCILPEKMQRAEWEHIRRLTVLRQQNRRRWLRMAACAASICLLAGLSLFLIQRRPTDGSPSLSPLAINEHQQDISLTLGDGRVIKLSELARDTMLSRIHGLAVTGDTLKHQSRNNQEDTTLEYNSLHIPRGAEYHLVLCDGTSVYLNSESKLSYPTVFQGRKREVWLEGEGFFQVSKNTEQPFIVHSRGVQIRVLGTSFGIRAYQDENQILTTLVQGSVQVSNQTKQVVLTPSEQAVCSPDGGPIEVKTVNTELYTGWINGRFLFENETLDTIITKLQKWYDFEVFYTQDYLRDLPFSVNLVKYEEYTEFFKVIEKTKTVRFSIKGKTVLVEPW